MLRQSPRAFVERLDFRSSSGERVCVVVTDLAVLEPRGADRELALTHVHPGSTVEQVRAATGWELRVAADLRATEPPSADELTVLRSLTTKGESRAA